MKKFRTSADMSRKVVNGNSRPSPDLRPRTIDKISSTSNVGKIGESKNVKSSTKPKVEKKPVIKGNDVVIKFD